MVIATKLLRNLYIKKSLKMNSVKLQDNVKVHIYYRTSDKGYPKEKPVYINNEHCLENALNVFPPEIVDWHIICDNCCNESLEKIRDTWKNHNCNVDNIKITNIGHGAGTFRIAYEDSLQYPDNDIIYFLENDYLHLDDSLNAINTGFQVLDSKIDYLTLYDHPDKYDMNYVFSYPYFKYSRIYNDGQRIWQRVPSTTMTFCARVSTLKKDKKIFWAYTGTKHPYDLEIFINLLMKKRVLVSPVMSLSTHGETKFLAKGIDWSKV